MYIVLDKLYNGSHSNKIIHNVNIHVPVCLWFDYFQGSEINLISSFGWLLFAYKITHKNRNIRNLS